MLMWHPFHNPLTQCPALHYITMVNQISERKNIKKRPGLKKPMTDSKCVFQSKHEKTLVEFEGDNIFICFLVH